MPKYNKKITSLMSYDEFEQGIQDLPEDRQAFVSVLYFSGCRVSEALALTSNDILCRENTIYVQFKRLKGSKQTDPIPLPNTRPLLWLCGQEGRLFPWCRKTGYNIVNRAFEGYYPHFFRQNRFTKAAEQFGLATMINFSGLAPTSVSHYIAKVDIGKVGKALKEELKK